MPQDIFLLHVFGECQKIDVKQICEEQMCNKCADVKRMQMCKCANVQISNVQMCKVASVGSLSQGKGRVPVPARGVISSRGSPTRPRCASAAGPIQGPCTQTLGDLYTESGQTLEDSFSAVSKPNFASKYAFESCRRDLHNAPFCTALQSQFFVKMLPNVC